MHIRFEPSIAAIPASSWDALAGSQPFLRHAFLQALEQSGCVGQDSGWQPWHACGWRDGVLVAAMPLYLKSHSYGEYVFDWAWADAYQRHGLAYYPKLLNAIPFSPVAGPRLLALEAADAQTLLNGVLAEAARLGVSSWHGLFPQAEQQPWFEQAGLLRRDGVQFHWQNRNYPDFAAFEMALSRDKRKKLRQERRKVQEAGVAVRRLHGSAIQAADWAFFERCYAHTYREHRSTPYLNLAFFQQLGQHMPEHCLLIVAERQGQPIATALNLLDDEALYGRYWGAQWDAQGWVPGLHFELCYYQGIEFAIEHGLQRFEGGAQGEHKLARGFDPVATCSYHWLAEPAFNDAVARFLAREGQGVAAYLDELNEHRAFRSSISLEK